MSVLETSKAEKTKVTALFNLLAEANGIDPSDYLHHVKVKELENNNVDDGSRPLLQRMAELQKENKKLRKRKEEEANGNKKQGEQNQKQNVEQTQNLK